MKKDYFFVGVQLLLFALYIREYQNWQFQSPDVLRIIAGIGAVGGTLLIGVALFQLGAGLTPFPTPRDNGELVRGGVFAFIRHPIYAGILGATFGWALMQGSGWKLGIVVLLYGLFHFKSKYEEALLTAKFPDYEAYRKVTGRFFPKWSNPKTS
ncbi:MAG: isoprenylcysteine carboxylmethyltransferase family protein [Bacteroidota bacterium]